MEVEDLIEAISRRWRVSAECEPINATDARIMVRSSTAVDAVMECAQNIAAQLRSKNYGVMQEQYGVTSSSFIIYRKKPAKLM
jgi:hypothetical protein